MGGIKRWLDKRHSHANKLNHDGACAIMMSNCTLGCRDDLEETCAGGFIWYAIVLEDNTLDGSILFKVSIPQSTYAHSLRF